MIDGGRWGWIGETAFGCSVLELLLIDRSMDWLQNKSKPWEVNWSFWETKECKFARDAEENTTRKERGLRRVDFCWWKNTATICKSLGRWKFGIRVNKGPLICETVDVSYRVSHRLLWDLSSLQSKCALSDLTCHSICYQYCFPTKWNVPTTTTVSRKRLVQQPQQQQHHNHHRGTRNMSPCWRSCSMIRRSCATVNTTLRTRTLWWRWSPKNGTRWTSRTNSQADKDVVLAAAITKVVLAAVSYHAGPALFNTSEEWRRSAITGV